MSNCGAHVLPSTHLINVSICPGHAACWPLGNASSLDVQGAAKLAQACWNATKNANRHPAAGGGTEAFAPLINALCEILAVIMIGYFIQRLQLAPQGMQAGLGTLARLDTC